MHFDLQPVPKAKNLDLIGWTGGYVLVQFKGRPAQWLYGPNIAEEEVAKVLRVPYPDKIFTLCIKNQFKCHKIEDR